MKIFSKIPWLIALGAIALGIYFKDEIFNLLNKNGAGKVVDFLTPKPKK